MIKILVAVMTGVTDMFQHVLAERFSESRSIHALQYNHRFPQLL